MRHITRDFTTSSYIRNTPFSLSFLLPDIVASRVVHTFSYFLVPFAPGEMTTPRSVSEQLATAQSRLSTGKDSVAVSVTNDGSLSRSGATTASSSAHNRQTSGNNATKTVTSIPPNLLPSAPASPPTPAPSPTPHQRSLNWQPSANEEDEDSFLLNARMHFNSLSNAKKQKFLMGILGLCDSQNLSFVSSFVSPRLRKDPFMVFPNELCLRVIIIYNKKKKSDCGFCLVVLS